jgi:phage/plasmid-associated DNA primase
LQEFEGAALIDNKSKALRRALIAIGDSNSGKSATIDVLSGLITSEPITTPISDLAGNHVMQSFIRRAPWVLHEAFDQSAWHISSKAKLILGGDFYEVNPKGKNAISMSFTAPAIWATNHEPKFRESTRAMINRMIMMRFSNVFDPENEIGTAAEARKRKYQEPQEFVLAEEKSGILNWALVGAQRAINRGHFKDTKEGLEALHEVRLDSNLAAGFVEECIEFDPSIRMSFPDFNAAYMSWWKEHRGDEHKISPEQIGRALKALSHAKIAIDRDKFKNDKGIRYICGIKFNEAGRDHWQNMVDEISAPNYGRNSDLARVSSSIASVHTKIPPGKNWWDHPLVFRIRENAAKAKAKKEEG